MALTSSAISRASTPPTVVSDTLPSRQSSNLESQILDNSTDLNNPDNTDANALESSNQLRSHPSLEVADPLTILDKHESDFLEQQEKRKARLCETWTDKSKLPESYYKNSKKEELVLAYVDNFNRQYTHLYPGRKELILTPPNEVGLKVIIKA